MKQVTLKSEGHMNLSLFLLEDFFPESFKKLNSILLGILRHVYKTVFYIKIKNVCRKLVLILL